MEKIKCVNCGEETEINIMNALDEDAEVFRCENCGYPFRYAPDNK
jgi:DNA-directed RNA polymerase subunit RPC12/RpoP